MTENILIVLLNSTGPINWTAVGVIGAIAIPIIAMLCNLLIKFGGFKQEFKTLSILTSDINKNTITLRSVTTFLYD